MTGYRSKDALCGSLVAMSLLLAVRAISADQAAQSGDPLPVNAQQTEQIFRAEMFAEAYKSWTARDYGKVVSLIRPMAESGNASAQFLLGGIHAKGEGVAQDDEAAVSWWRKAAMQGLPQAENELGVALIEGRGVAADPAAAVAWYRKAADRGFAIAQVNLGLAYWEGVGVNKDTAQAVTWFRKAAEQGTGWAQFYLGGAYATGVGVKKNEKEALAWLTKAAEQDYTEAQFKLGGMYSLGNLRLPAGFELAGGIPPDTGRAAYWYARAARNGDEPAGKQLTRVLADLARIRVRNSIEVREKPSATAEVVRNARVDELAYVLSRSREWVEVYLQDGHTLGFVSAPQLRK